MSSSTKLSLDSSRVEVSPTLYRSIVESLLYLTGSKPDIAFSVGVCARYQAALKESHLTTMKRIIRYINGTPEYGLWYSKDFNDCLAGYWMQIGQEMLMTERALRANVSILETTLYHG